MIETKLYHCTKFESLKAILKSMAFKPSYCLEQADYLDIKQSFAFAMVCFADLMDSEVAEHMNLFNSNCYLQMKKDWARGKRVSNVIYYNEETISAYAFKQIINEGIKNLLENNEELNNFTIGTSLLMALLKPYKGHYWDKNKHDWSTTETQFFNEREWRYVPIVKKREHFYLGEEEYKNEKIRNVCLESLNNDPKNLLHFTLNDIEAIGVENKDEEIEILDILKKIQLQQMSKTTPKIKIIKYGNKRH